MNVMIQAADLDAARVDGTRVYLSELLKRFGAIAPESVFDLYHRGQWNRALVPPPFPTYRERILARWPLWMQTRFGLELWLKRPEKLWLPVQAAPFCIPRTTEVTVTIHDLAFKYFPETFSMRDRFKLNLLLLLAVRRADKIIAVSESTKRDLLLFFPWLDEGTIRVIHHGFNVELFGRDVVPEEKERTLAKYGVQDGGYILYVGALQPRKNLVRLIEAFEIAKRKHSEMKLVLVGERAWLSDPIFSVAKKNVWSKDILFTGSVPFADLPALYRGARVFAFPSLYEGFGLPILEAFASGVPVLTADNSSLREVGGDAAVYCDALDVNDIANGLETLLSNKELRQEKIALGSDRLRHFSWDACARETIGYIAE